MDGIDRIAERVASVGLKINAIKLNTESPFTWASGFRMPIYNDNRMFLYNPEHREMIASSLLDVLARNKVEWDVVAGTSTAGISPATSLANKISFPFIYVRDKPKGHGLRNQIEGIDAETDLAGRRVVLVEDLISTGGSSAKAVQAIRDANGVCDNCISIFTYGLDKADRVFRGEEAFNKDGDKLRSVCQADSVLDYDILLSVAKDTGHISGAQVGALEEWRADPFNWGENHGFPKVEK